MLDDKAKIYGLRENVNGTPAHPLYLPGYLQPIIYK
jgi:hypothetical protein